MKKTLCLMLLLSLPFITIASPTVKIVTGEYEPYVSSHLPGGGPAVALVRSLCKEAGLTCTIEYYPWARALEMVETGVADVSFPWLKVDSRLSRLAYSKEPLYDLSLAAFYDKTRFPDGLAFQQYADLKNYKAVGVLSYWYEDTFRKLGIKTRWVMKSAEAWRMLETNKVDVFVDDKYTGLKEQKTYAKNLTKRLGVSVATELNAGAYLVYPKYSNRVDEIRVALDKAYQKLQGSKRLKEALAKMHPEH